jgi:hypothetical protein
MIQKVLTKRRGYKMEYYVYSALIVAVAISPAVILIWEFLK